MAIVARSDAGYARLSFHTGPGGALKIPVRVEYGQPFDGADWEAWEREYVENVVVETFPATAKGGGKTTDPFLLQDLQTILDWEDFYDGTPGARPF
jgi:hypothetical protein